MIGRLLAGTCALAFVAFVERADISPHRRRPRARTVVCRCALFLAIGLAPLAILAAGLPEGTFVRIESSYIEAGWHEGTLRRAQDGCWMVYLKNSTRGGYKLLALTTAKRLQVARSGKWQDASIAENLADQPSACLAEGTD